MIPAVDDIIHAPLEGDKRTGADDAGFYIRTYTGKQFHWRTPETNVYDIRDIAHALAMNCRWTGHVREFYSVAQHSVLAARYAPAEHKLAALLHDASEAYMHDTPSPLKWHLRDAGFTAFADLEKRIDQALFKSFGLAWPRDPAIKHVDLRLLATEHRDLMPYDPDKERAYMLPPYEDKITGWSWARAQASFLNMYEELTYVHDKS